MTNSFKTVALVGLFTDSRVAEPMIRLAEYLANAGITVLSNAATADALSARAVADNALSSDADLIIAIGGDGTMLHAAGLAAGGDVPLLGINRGRLGFLADVSPLDMLESLGQVLGGNYTSESRLQLEAKITATDGSQKTALALNDVVLQRRETGRMLEFETRIAKKYVNTHMGDGLIAATPTGSTAYALSCGGPIIQPRLDAIVVVPICPHTLSDRPIVIPADQEIEVKLLPREDTRAEVSVDGHTLGEFGPDDKLVIGEAEHRITLIHPPGYDFYEILRSKLHWGRNVRVQRPPLKG